MNIDKPIVLQLNAAWQAISKKTVKDAMVAMCGGLEGNTPPALALDIVYEEVEEGQFNFEKPIGITPVKWEDWIKLPIRNFDEVIHTSKLTIRVPTVLIAVNFNKVPRRIQKLTKQGIFARDGMVCQYTGKELPRHRLDIDHIVPKSRGGKDSWSNCVVADKEINRKKGNKLNSEAGLSLIKEPKEPIATPCVVIRTASQRDWEHFLIK
jgi:5-methylcytosine-specific restriction endonuclease McrA